MRLAIMQPYFFPYLGYFQLIHAVDKFVFYDDVNYIKNGWVNRNRLLANGRVSYFTVPLKAASPFKHIAETRVMEPASWKRRTLEMFRQSYARSAHFKIGMELVERVLDGRSENIGDLARASVLAVMRACGLTTEVVPSSATYGNSGLRGSARVLDICEREGATEYLNAPGGRELYEGNLFATRGIRLRFLEPTLTPYAQVRSKQFVEGLTVLDALLNCGPSFTRELMTHGRVVEP